MSDYSELKRLAEAATPGPYRQCGADSESKSCTCGQIWSTATDELVAFVHDGDEMIRAPAAGQSANAQFFAAANPAAVLAMIAENEDARRTGAFWKDEKICADAVISQFKAEIDRWKNIAANQKDRTEVAIEMAAAYREERDQLKAENERLRACAESIYRAAWDESGEGWNAEYPGDVHCKPEWNDRMKQTIDGIMSQGEQA